MAVSEYENTVTNALQAYGWIGMHVRPIYDGRRKRFITPTTTKGWPDMTFIHPRTGVILFGEVKGKADGYGKPTPHQLEWLHRLHRNPASCAMVFRPTDEWRRFCGWLKQPASMPSGYGWLPENEWRYPITLG